MRAPRKPYPVLIRWTAIALLPMPLLVGAMAAPAAPGCFEWCSVGQEFAAFAFRLVGVLWLFAVLVVAWPWRERESTVAVSSAVLASSALLIVTLRIYQVVSFEVIGLDLLLVAWGLGLGLQLPPVWRLSRRTPPSTPLRVVVGAMTLAVAVAALAVVFLGNRVGQADSLVVLTWFVFVAGLLLISVAALRDGVAAPSVIGPLVVACLPIVLLPVGIAAPGDIGYAIFLVLPLSAAAWLWIAAAWLRGTGLLASGRRAPAWARFSPRGSRGPRTPP
jgi:hypothetical protein